MIFYYGNGIRMVQKIKSGASGAPYIVMIFTKKYISMLLN